MDGRRAYRCKLCGSVWTQGLQGRKRNYSAQRPYYQFADTGAAAGPDRNGGPNWNETPAWAL